MTQEYLYAIIFSFMGISLIVLGCTWYIHRYVGEEPLGNDAEIYQIIIEQNNANTHPQ